jgi:hypothetical protein
MKKILSLALFLLSFNSFALGGFESLQDTEKQLLKSIVEQLGISDSDNKIKMKIHDATSFAFDGHWGSYWMGLNELASSKYQNGKEKGVIEISLNNSKSGTYFLTFIYKPEVKQIVVFQKQIRHGSKKQLLDEYEKRKANTEAYELRHESDNYALLQEKGKVDFEFFHVSGDTGSLVYSSQRVIDLLKM